MKIDNKEMILVRKRISADQRDVVLQFFDGEDLHEIKMSQFEEMKRSGRIG